MGNFPTNCSTVVGRIGLSSRKDSQLSWIIRRTTKGESEISSLFGSCAKFQRVQRVLNSCILCPCVSLRITDPLSLNSCPNWSMTITINDQIS